MKAKLMISFIFLLSVSSLYFYRFSEEKSTTSQQTLISSGDTNQFIIGAMGMGGVSGYEYYHPPFSSTINYYQQYDSMNFNLWHKYTILHVKQPRNLPHGWREVSKQDSLFADSTGDYIQGVKEILEANENHNLKTLMMRPKIEWLCFGQRSDYQCEYIPKDAGDFWYYSYDSTKTGIDTIDNSSYGNGARVKYCKYNSSNPGEDSGYAVKNLRSNREQVNPLETWQGDAQCAWLVKPRIRIDSSEVDNNPNKKVCRIDVYNYYGDGNDSNKIKSVDILVKNFVKSGSFNYDGKYLEEFYSDTSSSASPIKIDPGKFNPNKEEYFWTENCKADFRVYWYGLCDMWIDYVRVDNDVADRLLKLSGDAEFERWLRWEATDIARHGTSPWRFYIEEFEFNNLPCIKYVNEKLRSYNNNISLKANINYPLINAHIPYGVWGLVLII